MVVAAKKNRRTGRIPLGSTVFLCSVEPWGLVRGKQQVLAPITPVISLVSFIFRADRWIFYR
ncbi:hypothetical protein PAENIP36_03210 [Paenibacillus sp. P36]